MSDLQFPEEQETLQTIRRRMFVALRERWRPNSAERAAAALPRMAAQFSHDEDAQFADPACRSFYAALNDHPGLERISSWRLPRTCVFGTEIWTHSGAHI